MSRLPNSIYVVLPKLGGTNARKSCRGCVYRRPIGGGKDNYKVCHYLHDTGKPRGCPADHCNKKTVRR